MVRGHFILLAAFICACPCATTATAAERATGAPLPVDSIPVPETRPDQAAPAVPVPQEKPKSTGDDKPGDKPGDKGPPDKPAEALKPATPSEAEEKTPDNGPVKQEPSPPSDGKDTPSPTETKAEPVEKEDPQAYAACLADLKEAGVEFSEARTIDDGNGCGIDKPLTVRTVLPGIKLEPEATMRCQTALALSRWAKSSVLPTAEIAYGPDAPRITTFNQATSYACRNRNSAETGKISEHAHGNAIDIAGFTFSDGKTFVIEPREKDSTLVGAFERAITASACLFFTTVLGPASDAAHETHLHLDVIKRKSDYRYCW